MSNLIQEKKEYATSLQPSADRNTPVLINEIGPMTNYSEYQKQKNNTFIGLNPLLVSVLRGGERIPLDRPPYTSEVPLDKIYDLKYDTKYNTYFDIKTGQIQYWCPNDIGQVYRTPVFVTEACVNKNIRKNPMDIYYPEYNRLSSAPYKWSECNPTFCDSMTHDTLEFRQELMEKQMRKRNQQEWKYYWTNQE